VSDEPRRCAVEGDLAVELPGLRMWEVSVPVRDGRSGAGMRARLRYLADRVTGATVIALRQQPVPHAYRVMFRHIGLDPDTRRTPVEQAHLDRLQRGRFRSGGVVHDALLVALLETGVPVSALDEAALRGPLRLRQARPEDALVPERRLAVADDERAVAELFGPFVPEGLVGRGTARARLYAVAAPGVPEIHVEEAFDVALTALEEG
jgi:DNA/RNA-binding domain of Phe-tRNA-synthetase-like protein